MSINPTDTAALTERIRESSLAVSALLAEVRKVIVGQPKMVERLVIGLLADGHVLLEGYRGSPRRSPSGRSPAGSTPASRGSSSPPTSCRPT